MGSNIFYFFNTFDDTDPFSETPSQILTVYCQFFSLLFLSLPAVEQRQALAADERKREFHEEKRNEFESYAEEEHDGL